MDERVRRIWRDFWLGLVVVAVLVLANVAIEASPLGTTFEGWGDALRQFALGNPDTPKVVVVDTSDLAKATGTCNGQPQPITPRSTLTALIGKLVTFRPLAIGVDIDFSPCGGAYVSPNEDPAFFARVLQLRGDSGIPIFLGAYRSVVQGAPPKYWLGSSRYSSLAASLTLFKDQQRTIPTYVGSGAEQGPTMSYAIASAARQTLGVAENANSQWDWFANEQSPWRQTTLGGRKIVVDYRAIPFLYQGRIPAADAAGVSEQADRVRGNVVLLGHTQEGKTSDTCVIPTTFPDFPDGQVPCVLEHASGVFTLLQSPLYHMTWLGRFLADAVLAVSALGLVTFIRLYYAGRAEAEVATERLQTVSFALAALIVLSNLIVVRTTRLVWDDFVLVALVLFVHVPVEHWAEATLSWARANVPELWKRFVFREES